MLGGRLTINIISSDLPGETLASAPRYAPHRRGDAASCKTMLNGQAARPRRRVLEAEARSAARSAPSRARRRLLYFGGLSEDAREAAAKGCDVFLMWPDKARDGRRDHRRHDRARRQLRPHAAASATAPMSSCATPRPRRAPPPTGCSPSSTTRPGRGDPRQVARLDLGRRAAPGGAARERRPTTAMPRPTSGPASAARARAAARRSSAIPTRCWPSSNAYRAMGIEAFILSGYPHAAEADLFARHVLPHLDHGPLSRTG